MTAGIFLSFASTEAIPTGVQVQLQVKDRFHPQVLSLTTGSNPRFSWTPDPFSSLRATAVAERNGRYRLLEERDLPREHDKPMTVNGSFMSGKPLGHHKDSLKTGNQSVEDLFPAFPEGNKRQS